MALFGKDAEDIPNLIHSNSVVDFGQIEDAYETDPLVSHTAFYKRMRGKKGSFPPNTRKRILQEQMQEENDWEKIPVYCCAQINEITTIDTKTNTFSARVMIMMAMEMNLTEIQKRLEEEYQESIDLNRVSLQSERKKKLDLWMEIVSNIKADGTPYRIEDEEYEVFEEETEWPESLELFNRITEDQTEPTTFVILSTDSDGESLPTKAWVWIEFMEGLYEVKEYQELQYFPFDLQDLTLDFQLTSRRDIDKFDFRLHTVELYRPCLKMAEWVMYPPECDRKGTAKTSVRLRVTRKSGYYITNIVGMMGLLNIMNLTAFGIMVNAVADRLSVTMTMMLTAVAFKFIVGDQLPKVSYNTYLDIYLLYTMAFMFIASIYFASAPHFWNIFYDFDKNAEANVPEEVDDCDRWVFFVFTGTFIVFTGYWFFGAWQITKEIKEELPEHIVAPKGVTYINYRWQKVPFAGFENPPSERVRAGKSEIATPDPEFLRYMTSRDNRELEQIKSMNVKRSPGPTGGGRVSWVEDDMTDDFAEGSGTF